MVSSTINKGRVITTMEQNELETKIKTAQEEEAELKSKGDELEKIKAETADYAEQKVALQKEIDRNKATLETLHKDKEEAKVQNESFQKRFRNEQLEKAKTKAFVDFGITEPEEQKKVLDFFSKIDGGAIDSELIYRDLVRAVAAVDSDSYVKLRNKAASLSGSAQAFIKDESNLGGIVPPIENNEGAVVLDQKDLEAIRWSGMNPEVYKKLKREGKI